MEEDVKMGVGQIWSTNNFGDIEIVEYKNNKCVVVKFLNSGHIQESNAASIRKKYVKDMSFFSTEGIVERLKEAHAGKDYDYSLVDYKGSNTKVKVICQKHGVWEATPHNLLKPQGCPACGQESAKIKTTEAAKKRRVYTRESFIEASKALHEGRFSYENLEQDIYASNFVTITCKIHGDFSIAKFNHLRGLGSCPHCNPVKTKTHNELIALAREKFGQKFSYEASDDEVSIHTDVNVVCSVHGRFTTTFAKHMKSQYGGCWECLVDAGRRREPLSNEEFVQRSVDIHGVRYDYSL